MSWDEILCRGHEILSRGNEIIMLWERDKYFFHMSPQCCRRCAFIGFIKVITARTKM